MLKTETSNFRCTHCGKKGMPIQRKKSHLKEGGHLKKLFCIYCGIETNHVEIKEEHGYSNEDFELEFNNGNFVNGDRVLTLKQLKAKLREENDNND